MANKHRLLPAKVSPPKGLHAVACTCGGWDRFLQPDEKQARFREHVAAETGKVQRDAGHDPAEHRAELAAQVKRLHPSPRRARKR